MNWLKRMMCRTHTLYVCRRHRSTVSKQLMGKLLYVDVHGVYNFIACRHCGKVFHTDQPTHDRIHGEAP